MRLGLFLVATIVMATLAGCASMPADIAYELTTPRAFESNHFISAKNGLQVGLASHEGQSTDEVFSHVALSSGQIVLTEDFTPMSMFETIGVQQYLPYTHAGFLVIEDGVPFVYSMQSYETDVSKFGTIDGMRGGMDRTSLKDVINSRILVSIFDPPPEANRAKLLAYIKKIYEQHVPFDPFFDSDDHSRLYCSEFIAVALEQANARTPQPVPLSNNSSLAVAFRWLKFHDARVLAPGLFADSARHVATFSNSLDPKQVVAYFAIKRELYQRFTSDQRVGALIEIHSNSIVNFPPSIKQFLSQGLLMARFAKTSDPEQIAEMVHRFASTYFAKD